MNAVQMTMEAELLEQVDAAARDLGVSRSAFAREALRAALRRLAEQRQDAAHRSGYEKHPVQPGEFDWGDADDDWSGPWDEV